MSNIFKRKKNIQRRTHSKSPELELESKKKEFLISLKFFNLININLSHNSTIFFYLSKCLIK